MLVKDNTVEYHVSQEKNKLSQNYPRLRYGHDKPACRLLKTSQESHKWLISLRQSHCVIISSPLSPSQKSVKLIRSEKKRMQLWLQTDLAEKNYNHFTHRSCCSEHKSSSRKKKILTPNSKKKVLHAGLKYFDKLN